MLEQGEIPQESPDPKHAEEGEESLKETFEEPVALETDQEEDSDDGDSSAGMHALQMKNPRGRKSKKKKREEEAIQGIMDGTQKTLKVSGKSRAKKGTPSASKGAIPPHKS